MDWSQFETIKRLQDYWYRKYTDNLEKTSKLPFYNPYPYKPSKKLIRKLKEEAKNIEFTKHGK